MKPSILPKLILIPLVFAMAGCGKPKIETTLLDQGGAKEEVKKQEVSIKAKDGGALEFEPGDGSKVKIIFPQESLKTDAKLEVAARKDTGNDVLSSGFSLNQKGSKQGPELKYPALIYFYADKDLGKDVSIVHYKDDGKYEVVPTDVNIKNGKTFLTAQVKHFSDYGARRLTPDEISKGSEYDNGSQDYNWVIYVKDSYDVNLGPMKRKVTLDFKAVNQSGDISGSYNGYAHATTNNDMEAMGGKLDADFQIKDDNVSFTLDPYIELASLVPPEDDSLAALEPEKNPDYMGNGSLNMSGSGSGKVQVGAYGASTGIDAQESHDQFTVAVLVGSLYLFGI